MTRFLDGVAGLNWRWQIVAFALSVFAILSRRPDALLTPQFYAEDATVWYSDAYHFGWFSPLLVPYAGYFQTLPRLVAAVALSGPLQYAPLVMNIAGIIVQALPVTFLLSSRLAAWSPLVVRALMAFTYLALPNTVELDATITGGQWHLALLACMILLACPPKNTLWRIFDWCTILLSAFTGPFCLFLFPMALFIYWRRPACRSSLEIAILAVSFIAQSFALLRTASITRSGTSLGASPWLFMKILAGHVYLGALIGKNGLAAKTSVIVVLLGFVAAVGTAAVLHCFWKAALEFRLFILFSALVFAASLANPMVSLVRPQWEILENIRAARYWFFPMLAFVWVLIWCAYFSDRPYVRRASKVGLIVMCIGIVRDWRYPPYLDLHFSDYVRELASAPEGSLISVPIYPAGWSVRLTKKGSACQAPPLGAIDEPAENSGVFRLLRMAGWVAGANPIQKLSVYMDGALVESMLPNVRRPNIDLLYPESPDKEHGWQKMLDISKIVPGKHNFSIRALDTHGCDAEIAEVSIERRANSK